MQSTEQATKRMLNIGAGAVPVEAKGYKVVSLDIRGEAKPDIVSDCRKIPDPDESYESVYSSHVLEHFGRAEIGLVLIEWIRVLKKDGLFILIVPNLEYASTEIMSGILTGNVFDILYGAQNYAENFHKMGFVPKVLKEFLVSTNHLKNIEIKTRNNNFEIVARAIKI